MWHVLRRLHPPPPPPPPPPTQPHLLALTCCVILACASAKYLWTIIQPLRFPGSSRLIALSRRNAFLCVPCYPGFLLLFHHALTLTEGAQTSPIPEGIAQTRPLLAIYLVTPLAGFGLLFISEFLSWIFTCCLGPVTKYAYFRHPVMAVHASAGVFYFLSYLCGSVTLEDRFGRPLYPLRYVMWFVSVSSLGQSVYMLLDAMPGNTEYQMRVLHTRLARYLLAVPVCFGAGFFASWERNLNGSMLWLALSFAGFWYMLCAPPTSDPSPRGGLFLNAALHASLHAALHASMHASLLHAWTPADLACRVDAACG